METIKTKLIAILREAVINRPSVIVLDDLDLLIPNAEEQEVRENKNINDINRYGFPLSNLLPSYSTNI